MVQETRLVEGYHPMPIVFNEDDHYNFDQPVNNMINALKAGASWGLFDFRKRGETLTAIDSTFREGYQSVPVDWGINSQRKKEFFTLLEKISGLNSFRTENKKRIVSIDENAIRHQVIETEENRIINRANGLLNEKPRTVTATSSPRSAGGKHDFFSEGPYWWPDPANPNGPYLQHDGLRNPDRFVAHDDDLRFFSWIVGTHTSAYLLTGEEKYAKAAMQHMNAWFVDTTTRMNPNMLYAQAIHGICTGRGIGIIDAVQLMDVARSVQILEKSPAVSKKEIALIKKWFEQFIIWLTTHPYGIDEMNAKNNHGTWWHAQIAAYASLTGNEKILQQCKKWYSDVLLTDQMAADGGFPQELKRTKPYSYSLFNLDASASLAWILSNKNRDLWNHSLPDGRGMKRGLEFISPFLRDKSKWPYQKDVSHWDEQPDARQFMLFAALAGSGDEWLSLWKSLSKKNNDEESRLSMALKNPLIWIGLEVKQPHSKQ
jgi:hypothetical protein